MYKTIIKPSGTALLSLLTLLIWAVTGPAALSAETAPNPDTVTGHGPQPGPLTACDTVMFPSLKYLRCEQQNVRVALQNSTRHADLTLGLVAASAGYQRDRARFIFRDSERNPNPNPCTAIVLCPVDPRILNFEDGGGIVEPVLYTSRSGGTISGHVWATKAGPDKRPGVVIINGSVIGFDQIYWYAAQALAKAGFVVMTFDAQGEGNSDQFGEKPDALEAAFAGTPVLGLIAPQGVKNNGLGGNGLAFYDGGTDALNFFFSTPSQPYEPVPSRTTGTSHAAKQDRRVGANLNSAFNPLWQMLDTTRIGLAGHSYGAEAASYLAQEDDRVDTAVAWDNLCVPVQPSPTETAAVSGSRVFGPDKPPAPLVYGLPKECFGAPAGPAPEITKPALGITSDYFIAGPVPYLTPPDPDFNTAASRAYSDAGVDTGSLVIRGGTHFEYNDVPFLIPATLRGIDLVTWYTVGWFKKYLQDDPAGDRMLLTARWRRDERAGEIDPNDDPNLFSWHFRSRLNIELEDGSRFDCETLRVGCDGQIKAANDGGRADYSFDAIVNSTAENGGQATHQGNNARGGLLSGLLGRLNGG